jgi:prephenate dehydratase
MRVAYLGLAGAYSEAAAINHFGIDIDAVSCNSFGDVFSRVKSGDSDFGIVPIENSLAGSIHQNYDLLLQQPLFVVGEEYLRVQHCLIACPGVNIKDIRKIISHPQALAQCDAYIKSLDGIAIESVYNTAGSVKMIKDMGDRSIAAIASHLAANIYGMEILVEGIEDNPENYTRFLAVGREEIKVDVEAKTSIVFSIPNLPGSLYKTLGMFAKRNIDLTKMESRPLVGKPWEYLFYIDLVGLPGQGEIQEALSELKEFSTFLRILGTYARQKV